jgi:hypothetical protein
MSYDNSLGAESLAGSQTQPGVISFSARASKEQLNRISPFSGSRDEMLSRCNVAMLFRMDLGITCKKALLGYVCWRALGRF